MRLKRKGVAEGGGVVVQGDAMVGEVEPGLAMVGGEELYTILVSWLKVYNIDI